jgi:hypothetical protein
MWNTTTVAYRDVTIMQSALGQHDRKLTAYPGVRRDASALRKYQYCYQGTRARYVNISIAIKVLVKQCESNSLTFHQTAQRLMVPSNASLQWK